MFTQVMYRFLLPRHLAWLQVLHSVRLSGSAPPQRGCRSDKGPVNV